MKRWLFYISLAWRDISRLWQATQHQAVIVTGICLPVLILLGLKRGHVAELRQDLVTSPSGRQIVFWSAQRGELLSEDVLAKLKRNLPNTTSIVPESQRVVRLTPLVSSSPGAEEVAETANGMEDESLVTLYSTDVGDPVLKQYGADVLEKGEQGIILTEGAARRFNLKLGDSADARIFRRLAGVEETHSIGVVVRALIPGGDDSSLTGYANVDLLAQLEQYVRGHAVRALNLPMAQGVSPEDNYDEYLLFCQRGAQTEPSADDMEFLGDRGIACVEIDDANEASLYGLLDAERLTELRVFRLTQGSPDSPARGPLKTSPMYITENTQAVDDFALRWNLPQEMQTSRGRLRFVGLSLPTVSQSGGWIRDYLTHQHAGFDFEASLKSPLQVQLEEGVTSSNSSIVVDLESGDKVQLAVVTTAKTTDAEDAVPDALVVSTPTEKRAQANDVGTASWAIVPANCLAWIQEANRGKLVFDSTSNAFTRPAEPIQFDKARLYTETIDDVPAVVEQLASAGYAVLSEGNRIAEIQNQDRSLQALVVVVGVGVFVFGTVTVIGVLVDATERKRGTIGILRVMGMSRAGIFFVVILRATIVGVIAAVLSIGLGVAAAWAAEMVSGSEFSLGVYSLPPIPKVSIVLREQDYLIIAAGALLCSGLGAFVPAWRASAIDPFDAIVEGKFH